MYEVWNEFQITPLFNYIREKAREAGLYPENAKNKESIQLFLDHELLEDRAIRVGAIQYEGINSTQLEPNLVNWRFDRRLLPDDLRTELEAILAFRRDTNAGLNINLNAQSIAFKFEELTEQSKEAIEQIVGVISKYVKRKKEA
ncbi:hypothetical protein [Ureibacillus acetophenoni]|uniref:Uncharacterized protein n=1 Tax=Ureibacillus acetophenoni TaxID=614649 RepID=A0A285UN31_9BACL|nr:hypothetical protein [Ureibacillus acetophenoni]SOC43239.1 hypothetical protein SAMN05877842_11538 [Ureibacillus acetophenoni]